MVKKLIRSLCTAILLSKPAFYLAHLGKRLGGEQMKHMQWPEGTDKEFIKQWREAG